MTVVIFFNHIILVLDLRYFQFTMAHQNVIPSYAEEHLYLKKPSSSQFQTHTLNSQKQSDLKLSEQTANPATIKE